MESNVITTSVPRLNLRKVVQEYNIIIIDDNDIYNITIPKEFYYNGATIPCLFWTIFGTPYDCKNDTPGCVHDYLYDVKSDNSVLYQNTSYITINRNVSDKIYYYLLLQNNVSEYKAFIMYFVVRIFGFLYYKKN